MQPTRGEGHQTDENPLPTARKIQFGRRTLLKYSPGLASLALPGLQRIPISNGAAPNGGSTSRLQRVSGHALYTLPQDHMWHTGGIYDNGLLQEWHYWSGFFTDDDTGEQFGLFYNLEWQAVSPGVNQVVAWMSLGNFSTQQLIWTFKPLNGPLSATAPPGSTSPYDFQYSAQDSDTSFTTTYLATPDTWSVQFKGVAANVSGPMGLDLQVTTPTPWGYIPITPTGAPNQNAPWTGQYDPATMNSLSYYYAAMNQSVKGTVTAGGSVRRMTGSWWMEHQWGNFLWSKQPWASAYVWSHFDFYDGSFFTFQEWLDPNAQPLLNLGRNQYSTPDGNTTYGFGGSVVWEGLKTYTSPITGRNLPTQGRVTTQFGTWYYTAVFGAYEMPIGYPPVGTNGLDAWEGPVWVRSGSLDGPIIGKGFVELTSQLTTHYPALT